MKMKCYLGDLPESLFPLIKDYLIDKGTSFVNQVKGDIKSWNNFLNTNKSLFHKPKSTISFYYKFSRKISHAYISCDSSKCTPWVFESLRRVRSEVECPAEQIRLDLSWFDEKQLSSFFRDDSENTAKHFHSISVNDCEDLTKFPDSFEGKLFSFISHGCTITDIACLRGTSYVSLGDCLVEDVSPLQDCKIVILEFFSRLCDLSCLSGLHSLQLRSCEKVSDVSMLGGLYNLSIYDCPNITDVSALGGVRRLELHTGGTITSFLPYENQIGYLSCSAIYLPELLQFKNKQNTRLCLRDAGIDCNLFVLRGWKEVSFISISLQIINFGFIHPISDQDRVLAKDPLFLQQEVVQRLELAYMYKLKKIYGLSSLYYLKLSHCTFELQEIDFGSFLVLKQCYLDDCHLVRITIRGSIERLTIDANKKKITLLNVVKQMKQLFIENCNYGGLIRVQGLADKSFMSFVKSPKFVITEV